MAIADETNAMIEECFAPFRDDYDEDRLLDWRDDARRESEIDARGDVRCTDCDTEWDAGTRDCPCCGSERWLPV